jgi:hypothetical protein
MAEEAAELEGQGPSETVEDVVEDSQPSQDEPPVEPEKPKAKGVQKRLDELTALRRDAERDRDYWREMATRQKEPEPEPKVAPQGKPELDTYGSYDEYVEALADWKFDQRMQAERSREQEQQLEQTRAQQVQTFQQRAQSVREAHDDFDEVVGNRSLPISEAMAETAYASEKGPELLYYLGQHPREAARIYALSPYAQAMEMGKLEVAISQPSRTQTSAPDPIEPVSGVGGPQSVDPDKMTTAEWVQWRNNQLKR